MNTARYNEKEADNLDRLIHWALVRSAEKLTVSKEQKNKNSEKS